MKDIGVGVIGIGMGANMLLLNKEPKSRFEVRALCSGTLSKVKALAEQSGVKHYTTDYRELLERDDIHVIGVYSPDHLHAEHCIAALEAGKHVVCTKPMVTSLKDAETLVKLVRRTGLKFLVGQTMRFDPQFVTAKRLLDDGELGEVIFAEAHYVHDLRGVGELTPWRVEVPQDLVYGGGCHPVDVLRWLVGDIAEVFAYGNRSGISKYPKEENFLVNLKFTSGKPGRILAAYGLVHPPMPMMGAGLYCTKASLVADFSDFEGGSVKVVFDKVPQHTPFTSRFLPETEGAYGHGRAVVRYMEHFQECLADDKEPSPGAIDGAKTVAVGSAIWTSLKTGKPVKVKSDF